MNLYQPRRRCSKNQDKEAKLSVIFPHPVYHSLSNLGRLRALFNYRLVFVAPVGFLLCLVS